MPTRGQCHYDIRPVSRHCWLLIPTELPSPSALACAFVPGLDWPTLCEPIKGPKMRSRRCPGRERSGQSLHPDPEPGGCVRRRGRGVAQIKGVTSAEAVTGPYDVIALVEARNLNDLGRLVVGKVQAIEGSHAL